MFRRNRLYALIVAELGTILFLVLLFFIFRIPPGKPGAQPTPIAQAAAPTTAPATPLPTSGQPAEASTSLPATNTPVPPMQQYTVVEGDTLWGIAVNFHLTLDELVAANPAINPDRLYPGDVVNVPAPGTIDTSQITHQPTAPPAQADNVTAQVKSDAGGLRLRKGPGTDADVITKLPDSTPLTLLGRTANDAWLQVALSDGTHGWVMAQYVDITGNLASIGVVDAGQTQTSGSETTGNANLVPRDEPYISGITAKSLDIFKAGQAKGNHANVFTVVGDSNTDNPAFLQPLDRGDYNLGDYAYLQDTITYFRGSFARSQSSHAALGGFNTSKVLDPANSGSGCDRTETPLDCEYRITKPSIALILLGTGDQHTWQGFEARYRTIIEDTINQGIIPVLITKGDSLESRDNTAPYGYINAIIARLSREYDVPLLDLHQAIVPLPNTGFNPDGFHFNAPPDGKSCNFLGDWMRYGYTIRNLTALQMLDAIRRQVISQAG